MEDRTKPRRLEVSTQSCFCDSCKKDLSSLTEIWIWDAYFACSKKCIFEIYNNNNIEKDSDLL